ncbi:LOW QUALITY PROTEIN: uncharacterized protein [Blastocystis hominis]|uniref:Uncharacterized protein n=1 Tax=Blastocystis hominis TaxID=12968 RepID=D8M1V9_BLAHO|nr:LOW QUALITY PROTEIN: uncharacterized protein [Blastocystis hominis]CBK22048.2 unnamed protein product [Blastocystis hominis]|eukprot:XP_012896096.1 LOW QUALITY PROTEIN: uncharacterized protein [Blastocystis hominis]
MDCLLGEFSFLSRQTRRIESLSSQNRELSLQLQTQQAKISTLQDEKLRLLGEMGTVRCVEIPSSADATQSKLLQVTREKEELSIYLEHILRELEDKTPILEARQKAFEALQEDYHALLQRWNGHVASVQPSGEDAASDELLNALYAEMRRLSRESQRAQERVAITEQQRDFYRRLLVDRRCDDAMKRLLEKEEETKRVEKEKLEKEMEEMREREKQLRWEMDSKRGIVETREREHGLLQEERDRFKTSCEAYQKRISQLTTRLSEIELKNGMAKFDQISLLSHITQFIHEESAEQLLQSVLLSNSGITNLLLSLQHATVELSQSLQQCSFPPAPSLPALSDAAPLAPLDIPAELSALRVQKKELEETMQEMEEEAEDMSTAMDRMQREHDQLQTQTLSLASQARKGAARRHRSPRESDLRRNRGKDGGLREIR